jgi:RNA polymerase sigma factor (sigma-70 family)
MAYGQLNVVLAHLRRLVHQPGAGVDDGVLLERFVRQRDEAAFEVLVWRHGPMVLSLAHRLLRSPHDAEDVLQATFLTLVRKANSIGKRESIASWLYKVGYRVALRARARSGKVPVPGGSLEHVPAGPAKATDGELGPLLDRAILRLPEKNRAAIVLCHFEGKTIREAAAQLGCPAGTVAARLSRGRELLRRRLCRDGVALTSGAVAAALSQEAASAAVPAGLVTAILRSAWATIAGKATVASIPATISALVESGSAATTLAKCSLGVAVIVGGMLALGASALARRDNAAAPPVSDAREVSAATAPRGNLDPPVPAAKKPPAGETMIVTGRVLDPDGKSIAGARLYYPRWQEPFPNYPDTLPTPERGITDADGRFRIELPRSDMPKRFDYFLVAMAAGFGIEGASVPRNASTAELTMRLVKDGPIEGRILDSEGRPIAGVELQVGDVYASSHEKLDDFLSAWGGYDWVSALQRLEFRR